MGAGYEVWVVLVDFGSRQWSCLCSQFGHGSSGTSTPTDAVVLRARSFAPPKLSLRMTRGSAQVWGCSGAGGVGAERVVRGEQTQRNLFKYQGFSSTRKALVFPKWRSPHPPLKRSPFPSGGRLLVLRFRSWFCLCSAQDSSVC